MPTLTRTQTRPQPIAHRRLPLAAHERLIGREPKALRVTQSSKIGEIGPAPRTKSGANEKITSTLIKISHTNRPAQSNFPVRNLVD